MRDGLRFLDPAENKTADYGFTYRVDNRKLDSDGKLKSRETVAGRKEFQEGYPVWRLTEKNGKALTEQERGDQEKRIREYLDAEKKITPEERARRRRQDSDDDAWIKEVPDALEFKIAGVENIHGRPAWALTCGPRPGYSAKSMRARVFEKMRGKLWIDQADRQLAKVEAETFDRVSVGFGIIGRIEKGTRFALLRRRVDDGAWLLENQSIKFGARVMLVKWIGNEIETSFADWRRKPEAR